MEELREALGYYCERRRDWITIEYVLLEGVNDGAADAVALRAFVTPPIRAKVNLIVYNPVPGLPFSALWADAGFSADALASGIDYYDSAQSGQRYCCRLWSARSPLWPKRIGLSIALIGLRPCAHGVGV